MTRPAQAPESRNIAPPVSRVRLDLSGQVQGVGFRPYVYREAHRMGLTGFVSNNRAGAAIEVEGPIDRVEQFVASTLTHLPPLASISDVRRSDRPLRREHCFRIVESQQNETAQADVTPDAACCPDCFRELFDTSDRRHGYAFINCTNCGPRYSIIRDVPYDRNATTMSAFAMCDACRREYTNPADRRFHAQPVACPQCGPRVQLLDRTGRPLSGDPIAQAAALIAGGAIVAVKGIGGYHLACRADDEAVVGALRRRKLRDGKPLAIMVADLAAADRLCRLSNSDRAALASAAAPIVLVEKRRNADVADAVAPGCHDLGLLLPYSPLHHLLFARGVGPLVMTSANRSADPLTFRDDDALRELSDLADAFLSHDREIFRPIDDSVVFSFRDAVVPVRRARGYVPGVISIPHRPTAAPDILAVGAELKSTFCLLVGSRAIVSEHLGDLTGARAYRHFVDAIERCRDLFHARPAVVAHDLHPAYLSTHFARSLGLPLLPVQHHHAHVASLMAEYDEPGPVIGLACDGTGYGTDGAVWGCELFRCDRGDFDRLAHLEYFPLIGGDLAAIETWRPAMALLHMAYGPGWRDALLTRASAVLRRFEEAENCDLRLAETQIQRRVNCPPTSSLGRVFDAVAFLLGLCERNRHEAEAAMSLESAAAQVGTPIEPYPAPFGEDGAIRLGPLIRAIVNDIASESPVNLIAARFHESIALLLARSAIRAARDNRIGVVGFSGGCFLNRRLLERVTEMLEQTDLRVLIHRKVPPGDGGVSLGQAYVASWKSGQATSSP